MTSEPSGDSNRHPKMKLQEDLRTILKWVTCSLPEEVLQDILKDAHLHFGFTQKVEPLVNYRFSEEMKGFLQTLR